MEARGLMGREYRPCDAYVKVGTKAHMKPFVLKILKGFVYDTMSRDWALQNNQN